MPGAHAGDHATDGRMIETHHVPLYIILSRDSADTNHMCETRGSAMKA